MDSLFEHYKKTGYLHHAHLIQGAYEYVAPILIELLEKHMGVFARHNPDVTLLSFRMFGIDESRNLSEMQTRAGFSTEETSKGVLQKFFIVGADSMTREAQTALLKTFEEPTEGTHFFFIVPRTDTILATLKSRVVLFNPQNASGDIGETEMVAEKFLRHTLGERFALIKKITETKKDVPVDREMIRAVLDHLERILYTRLAGKRETTNIFHEIYQAKNYLADRGSSPKMLLEHLAIAIPESN